MPRRKVGPGGGKQKGSSFEREICYLLSEWWCGEPNVDIFWRTSNSGGRATILSNRPVVSKARGQGDLMAVDPSGEPLLKVLTWELKRGYPQASLHALLDKPAFAKAQVYEEWMNQAERDRQRAGALYWAIVHKRDMRVPLVTTHRSLILQLEQMGAYPFGLTLPTTDMMVQLPATTPKEEPRIQALTALTLDDFLRAKPEHFLALLKQRKDSSADGLLQPTPAQPSPAKPSGDLPLSQVQPTSPGPAA